MNLKNAKILITGGSLGLGKDMAQLLVEAGAKVVITGRDQGRLQLAAGQTGAHPCVADMSNTDDIARSYAETVAHLGGLDCLINNAGIGEFPKMEEATLDQFERIFRVNVFGASQMAQAVVPAFKAQKYGHIINIGSTAALKGFVGGSVYAASKFALRGMTQCWQEELRKFNIRVMLINPSMVATAFGNPERIERELVDNHLSPREIAHAVKAALEMDDRGMIPEVAVWATNPW